MPMHPFALCLPLLLPLTAHAVTLSNLRLPRTTTGAEIITGEASVLQHGGFFFFFFNDWGSCPGVDCCASSGGCASCCFSHPPHPFAPGCSSPTNGSNPYGNYHVVRAYRTSDFVTWVDLGVALTYQYGHASLFRPHVVYSRASKRFVMWFEDRSCQARACGEYYVATAASPEGPYSGAAAVTLPGSGSVGDFDVFVDDDGTGYHVRTGFDIVRLTPGLTAPASLVAGGITTPLPAEAPIVFRRQGSYYLLAGVGCCACIGGSNLYVLRASSLAGPWRLQGDVGASKPPSEWDPHSRNNFVTRSQGSAVIRVPERDAANASFVYLGNQWNSGLAQTPPGPRNHDLLYWGVLRFESDGNILPLAWRDSATFEVGREGRRMAMGRRAQAAATAGLPRSYEPS